MELKRNPMGQIPQNHQKQSHLMQPFINISKASTPVRTRVVPTGSQMNSTPISINKIAGNLHKSPNNKENHHSNYRKTETRNEFAAKMQGNHHQSQNRINLSPILALNRKFNEGHKFQNKKSLTPESHKVNSDYEGFSNEVVNKLEKNYASNTSLHDSKGTNFNSTTNLRGSNCFKALIQNRCKSPNRLENSQGKSMQKKDSTPLLKESMSSNQLFRNFGQESRSKLSQSRSFDQLRGLGNNRIVGSEIKCMNNDGKKAKYIVVNSDDEKFNSQHGKLYFCSKCTIPLVQQGFIVQQISKQAIRDEFGQSSEAAISQDYRYQLQAKRKNVECKLIELSQKQQDEMNKLDEYYEQIFAYLQQQRYIDRRKIEQSFKEKKSQPLTYIKEINRCIQTLDEVVNSPKHKSSRVAEIEELIQHQLPFDNYNNWGAFEENLPELIARFTKTFDEMLRPRLTRNKKVNTLQFSKGNDVAGNRNHAMRFSFEKLLGGNCDHSTNQRRINRDAIDPLIEVDEEYVDNELEPQKQEHQAFRDLFPEEEDSKFMNNDIHSPTFKNI